MADNPYQPPTADISQQRRETCQCCGGNTFRNGSVMLGSIGQTGMTFTPDDWPLFRLRQGLAISAMACRDCGHISLFVADQDMGALQQ